MVYSEVPNFSEPNPELLAQANQQNKSVSTDASAQEPPTGHATLTLILFLFLHFTVNIYNYWLVIFLKYLNCSQTGDMTFPVLSSFLSTTLFFKLFLSG